MALVIGKGKSFYDVPEDVLAKYALPEDKAAKIKENVQKISLNKGDSDVEGYGHFDGLHEEGHMSCNYWGDDHMKI
jgi:hypothetical protein